ncbi:hypothetical protein DPMN_004494 [Dreissena polymorpha]|uniref:Uncharacterized protein n=1 Tax=Dreissena polymorpha TaxID=45954 RepID=A0A9D4RVZ0_DREPO|nr:hypothetical protein DPMN_004494 [Dreissena polymorpha]
MVHSGNPEKGDDKMVITSKFAGKFPKPDLYPWNTCMTCLHVSVWTEHVTQDVEDVCLQLDPSLDLRYMDLLQIHQHFWDTQDRVIQTWSGADSK